MVLLGELKIEIVKLDIIDPSFYDQNNNFQVRF